MPYRNPFFFSKRALAKIDKIREQTRDELKNGPTAPIKVNTFKTNNKLTVGKSMNVHLPIKKSLENKPVVAKSLNQYPAETIKPRDIQEVIPAVNGKAAPSLVRPTPKKTPQQDFFPVVEKVKKATKKKRQRSKKTPGA